MLEAAAGFPVPGPALPERADRRRLDVADRVLAGADPDVAVGLDKLTVGRVPFRVRLTVINLFDTVALYNFLSTFSGTHFVTPRAVQVQVSVPF